MSKSENAKNIFNQFAEAYEQKYMDLSMYHDSFDLFCELIKNKNAKILDIGCGPGNITKYLLERNPDFQIDGIDIAPKMIELAKRNNPTASFQIMDSKDIGQLKTKYDGIICGFCLPYLSKAESIKLIENATKLLTKNGVFYLSTMEDDYSKSGYVGSSQGDAEQLYTYYHQEDYLVKALIKNGLTLSHLERKKYQNSKSELVKDLILIVAN